jgi:hypothetical protein
VADSRDVAKGLEIQHDNFLGTIETHRATIEAEFGILLFQTGTSTNSISATHKTRFAYFTENQALFVATLLRNSAAVVRVKAFGGVSPCFCGLPEGGCQNRLQGSALFCVVRMPAACSAFARRTHRPAKHLHHA